MASSPAARCCSWKIASASFFAEDLEKLVAEAGVAVPLDGGAESTPGVEDNGVEFAVELVMDGVEAIGTALGAAGVGTTFGAKVSSSSSSSSSFFPSNALGAVEDGVVDLGVPPMLKEGAALGAAPPMLSDGAALGAPPPMLREGAALGAPPPILNDGAGLGAPPPILNDGAGFGAPPPMLSEGAGFGAPPPMLSEGAGLGAPPPILSETGFEASVDGMEGGWNP